MLKRWVILFLVVFGALGGLVALKTAGVLPKTGRLAGLQAETAKQGPLAGDPISGGVNPQETGKRSIPLSVADQQGTSTSQKQQPAADTSTSGKLSATALPIGKWVPVAGRGATGDRVEAALPTITSQADGLSISVRLPGFVLNEHRLDGEVFQSLDIPGWSARQEVGNPAVPGRNLILAIPEGVDPVVQLARAQSLTIQDIDYVPAQPPYADVRPEPPRPPLQQNEELYAKEAWYPVSPVLSASVSRMRNKRLLTIELTPVQVNPVAREALVLTDMVIEVAYEKWPEQTLSPALLPSAPDKQVVLPEGFSSGEPGVYTVLTDDQWASSTNLAAFMEWKRHKGYRVNMIKTSDIDAGGAPTHDQIRDYLRALPAADYPEYLLIIGTESAASGVEGYFFTTQDGGWSDLYLSCRTASDDIPDLFCGRLPVSSTAHLDTMIGKLLSADRNPDPYPYRQRVNVAGMIQDSDDGNNVADRLFCETADSIACYFEQDAGGVDYDCQRAVMNPSGMTSAGTWNPGSILWNSGTAIGSRIVTTFVAEATATARITADINKGCALVQHRDHGYTGGYGWADPDYRNTHINALTNGTRLTAVFSINCASGAYHENLFLRAWFQNTQGGAYAVLAPVDISYSWHNDWLTHGFYAAFLDDYITWHNASTYPDWPKNLPAPGGAYGAAGSAGRLGEILNFGKLYLAENYSTWITNQRLFHLFGDPEGWLQIENLVTQNVTHAETASVGANTIVLDTGAEGAQVCLYSEACDVVAVALAPASGVVSLDIEPVTTGTVFVTVTRKGAIPYEGTLTITGEAPAYVRYHAQTLDDGDADGRLEPGETGQLFLILENAGSADAHQVEAELVSLSAELTVSGNDTQSFGTIGASAVGTNAAAFSVAAASDAEAGVYDMQLIIHADEGVWTNTFELSIETAATLAFGPSALTFSAVEEEADSDILYLTNSGSADLVYSISDTFSILSTNYVQEDSREAGGPDFNWIDITGTGTNAMLTDDGETGLLDIGFAFSFYGTSYTQFMIGANGAIAFQSGSVGVYNASLPSSELPGPSIAAFWDDLNPAAGGAVYYQASSSRLVVSWVGVPRYGTSDAETFQVILEPSGQILIQYLTLNGILTACTVGLQAGTTGPSIQTTYNAAYLENNLAVRYTTASGGWLWCDNRLGVLAPGQATGLVVEASAAGLSAGSYTASVFLAHNDPDQATRTVPAVLTVYSSTLPEPWAGADVGQVAASGRASWTAGVFSVSGSGADIEGYSGDHFHWVYQVCTGEVQLVARVLSQENTHLWAKAGIMMRSGTASDSRQAILAVTPDHRWQWLARATEGSTTIVETNSSGVTLPYSLKIVREGEDLVGFSSADGTNWIQRGRQHFANLPAALYVGLPVCSHVEDQLGTATFDGVRVEASDSDHDAIPNYWEQLHSGSITGCVADADSDQDGLTDYGEYVTGCDPTNAASVFTAVGATPESGQVLNWPHADGRLYTVYVSTNLENGFEVLARDLVVGSFTDTLHNASARTYYRIEVKIP